MLHQRTIPSFIGVICLLTVLLAGCNTANTNVGPTQTGRTVTTKSTSSQIIITAVDYGYLLSTTSVQAGLIPFALVNNGTQPHQAQLARLKPGVTRQQVFDAFVTQGDQARGAGLLLFVGGPDTVSPGYGQETLLALPAGEYVILCLVVDADGISHVSKGMLYFLTVTPTPSAEKAQNLPSTAGTINITDTGYTLPTALTRTGKLNFLVNNTDTEAHELNIIKLAQGKSISDVIAFFQSPFGPPPFEEEGGMATLSAHHTGWLSTDLDAGNYAVVSFVPTATGKPQLLSGMYSAFTVQP